VHWLQLWRLLGLRLQLRAAILEDPAVAPWEPSCRANVLQRCRLKIAEVSDSFDQLLAAAGAAARGVVRGKSAVLPIRREMVNTATGRQQSQSAHSTVEDPALRC
jgi:hypothetical protein